MSEAGNMNPGEISAAELQSALFGQLVMQQANLAFMLLGKTPHPETGKTVRDLDGGAVMPGDTLVYEITLVNGGNAVAASVRVQDSLPARTTLVLAAYDGPGSLHYDPPPAGASGRGVVTIERGCGLTRLPHASIYDDEPQAYWKRGHLNVVHAQMRMRELADILFAWKAGTPAEATVAARIQQMGA